MAFRFIHNNINVTDLDRSIAFYSEALGLRVARFKESADGSFRLAFLEDGHSGWQLELTWLRDHAQPYDLGENESHFCLEADDYSAAFQKHKDMQCVCFENPEMGIYFIEDPDGYWIEIVPAQ